MGQKDNQNSISQRQFRNRPPHNNRRQEPNMTGNNNSETDMLFHLPGNSVSEVGERIKGGAVKEDKSPENEAILINV